MGRVSYERETKMIEEVKLLEEQHCKRLHQERVLGDHEERRKELDAMVDSLTDVFQKLSPNDPDNIRSVYELQKHHVVSIIVTSQFQYIAGDSGLIKQLHPQILYLLLLLFIAFNSRNWIIKRKAIGDQFTSTE